MYPQPLIAVADVEKTSQWYQTVLGLESGHGGKEYEQLLFEQRMVLQLHQWQAHEHPHIGDPKRLIGNGVLLWFESNQFDEIVQKLQTHQVEILEGPKYNPNAHHREIWFRDLNGYTLVVASPYGDL
ncbi:VOC family protein [Acinetobacter vivianii]|jgi:catechol 2,3-dioxygenase-like lactoylglutathione lyase family enzyme|uniref:VOC family protein n=1 Tax=Acinetobacter vivianii TaxID=1776742 RepID=UPI002DC03EEC|nr:VOC family protein [Acinetobacter vivianii]MEB6480169.1 VOC family protein [Acinetobacter vivianii]MEB6658616.1 VOC family protein [Acinetobacter vivianii]